MKSIGKKLLISLLLVILLFNFIMKPLSFASIRDIVTEALGTFVGVITWIPRLIAIATAYAMDMLAAGIAYVDGEVSGDSFKDSSKVFVTPFDIVFGKAAITDIDFLNVKDDDSSAVMKIRNAVAQWYYFMRIIAVSILLVVLVYVGIRMALSTIAEDKAKYKKMLVDWAASLALVFLLQYLIAFMITLNKVIVDAIAKTSSSTTKDLAKALGEIALEALGVGVDGIAATVVFCLFVYQTFVILFSYINRMIRIAFLIIIAPLITITYSIDKMGDGKAQALNEWMKEFITSVLIQPFHCVIYMVFVSIAIELLQHPGVGTNRMAASVVAVLCMLFLKDAEKILRKIFNLTGDDNAASLATGAVMASAALSKSKQIGKTARQGVNAVKNMYPIQHGKEDAGKVRDRIQAGRNAKQNGTSVKSEYELLRAERVQREETKRETKENKKLDKIAAQGNRAEQFDRQAKDGNTEIGKAVKAKKDQIDQEAIKKDIRQKNPKMTEEEVNKAADEKATEMAKTSVKRDMVKEGKYKDISIRGVVRSNAQKVSNKVSSGYKAFKSSHFGRYVRNSVSTGIGMAVGSMALDTQNVFVAIATGGAAAGATREFMNSSNDFIAEGAAANAAALNLQTEEDVVNTYDAYSSGTSQKNLENSEDTVRAQLSNENGDLKKANGDPIDSKDVERFLQTVRSGISRKPDEDPKALFEMAANKTGMNLDQALTEKLEAAIRNMQTSINQIQVGQTIDQAKGYGASISSMAGSIIHASQSMPIWEGVDADIQKVYNANDTMRNTRLEDNDQIASINTELNSAGISIQRYLAEMGVLRDNIQRSTLPEDKKNAQVANLNHNMDKIKDWVNSQQTS